MLSDLRHDRLVLAGNPEEIHIGAHFYNAARDLGIDVRLLDVRRAFAGPKWLNQANWWLRGHYPTSLTGFSDEVAACCRECSPAWLLSVGIAPIRAEALDEIGGCGVKRLNFLTDDPWNEAHRAPWFLKALRRYDHVFSPRRANMHELLQSGCGEVSYLPFAYAPEIHFPYEASAPQWDIAFAGGADRERVPWIAALLRAGYKVGLYGGYWDRYPETRAHAKGHASAAGVRSLVAGSRMALGLVRRANHDGHSMRTFELPAMRCCMLIEDTDEHREIFGDDGQCVLYFRTVPELLKAASLLMGDEGERRRLAEAAYERVTTGSNTYRDRLASMLQLSVARDRHRLEHTNWD
jgi:hypothetical protein